MSRVENMNWMFGGSSFTGDISNWDISGVMFMIAMFKNSKFNGDISNWDVSNVTRMAAMFKNSPLESLYGVDGSKLKKDLKNDNS